MDVKLVIFKNDGNKKEIDVRPGRYVVGRRPDAQLRIPLPSVSRDHCEIVHDGRSLTVRDLGSSNGTFKNRERIKNATLGAGDILGVGSFVMTVQIDGKPTNIRPPVGGENDDSSLSDTPATSGSGSFAQDGLEETITKSSQQPEEQPTIPSDDSSVFEFDFDFEDDDRPKL